MPEAYGENQLLIRRLREIPELRYDEKEVTARRDCLSLKGLFLKKNMDFYHVDQLCLYRIAAKVLKIQKQLQEIPIYAGFYDLADVYVDMDPQDPSVCMLHPERFQTEEKEQDYEWYPEDERIYGDLERMDSSSQRIADQRFLYKILIASNRGNVKVPPRNSQQDYSYLFYGSLPERWRRWFETEEIHSLDEWKEELDQVIREAEVRQESRLEAAHRTMTGDGMAGSQAERLAQIPQGQKDLFVLFLILRTERRNSLEMSRMLYEMQDRLELEQARRHGRILQGFVYGDGVVRRKDMREYSEGYRVQIPQMIREYSIEEALLIGCDWMQEIRSRTAEDLSADYRMYILSDGRVTNNAMFRVCVDRIGHLLEDGLEVELVLGRDSDCEGWEKLQEKIPAGEEGRRWLCFRN